MTRLAKECLPVGQSGREQDLRTFLGTFNFGGDMVKQPVGTMSGGEKARLVLCMIVWQRPNLLLLDEPTNHLDLATREALSIALNEFEGTVMLVSHDRALLREVCDEFWLVTHGGVSPFDGDLDDYQRWLLEVSRAVQRGLPPPALPSLLGAAATPVPAPAPRAAAAPPPPPTATTRDDRQAAKQTRARRAERTRPLRYEIKQIDDQLARLAAERAEVEALLGQPRLDAQGFADQGRRLAHIQADTSRLEERWLALHTQLDALEAAS
jgi:ATP-binding cassette subfamily F protein 3